MSEKGIMWVLSNFNLLMFVLAVIYVLIHRMIVKHNVPEAEIVYRWVSLFNLGIAGLYMAIVNAFYPAVAAMAMGWVSSPYQWQIAMIGLAIAVIGIMSFRASYSFRLATVIASTIFLWGAALGHLYQIIVFRNLTVGNAGSTLWMDIIVPIVLIGCLCSFKRAQGYPSQVSR